MHIMTILILTMFLDIDCLPSYHWLMHPILSRDLCHVTRLNQNKNKKYQFEYEINPANAGVLLKKVCHSIRAELH